MKNTGTLKVTAPSDREIVMTRVFDAPRRLVYEAFTKPELVKLKRFELGWHLSRDCAGGAHRAHGGV
jgi:uncharacterized protein YndB with AHSA1/START domain